MSSRPVADVAERHSWWRRHQLSFSLALFVVFIVAALSGELGFIGPWDRIGSSSPALLLYGLACAIYVGIANVIYGAGELAEKVMRPTSVVTFRRCAFAILLVVGIATPLVWPVVSAFLP
jgi:hypothetical protein